MGRWSEWAYWDPRLIRRNEKLWKAGTYRIRLLHIGHACPINRFRGMDRDGILYIGQGASLWTRIREFNKTATAAEGSITHSGGRMFWAQPKSLKGTSLQYQYHLVNNGKAGAVRDEADLLLTYFKVFGELPPLNSSASSYFWKQMGVVTA